MKAHNPYDFPFIPVIIIGAPRSGTNALRDTLTALTDFETWPCDEINPIWRHGNMWHPNDEIPLERARPRVRHSIRRAFHRIWLDQGRPPFVVEKTCANSLRVPFVNEILPEARFVYIVRDGFDVIASACQRWRGHMEMASVPYLLAKARYTPLTDLPFYGLSFLKSRLKLIARATSHLDSWGPRYSGMEEHIEGSLEELCARQWAACVVRSYHDLLEVSSSRVIHITYEDFVSEPIATLVRILSFLGHNADIEQLENATRTVHSTSRGKGRKLRAELDPAIREIMKVPLDIHGYDT